MLEEEDQFSQDESSLGETIVLQLKKDIMNAMKKKLFLLHENCAVVKQILRVLTLF